MPETLVKVDNISKKFCRNLKRSLWYGVKDIASEIFGGRAAEDLRKDEFWAVKNVSFELKRGECLGLIGHNGAGKSTLLKMLNGLIKPDNGSIMMKGRIGALIELGAGFNPILTGRENIYINGQILGFTKTEIDKKFNDIVDFAEIGEFIESPVQNYSSGMKVRLGFAVASQMEPDVLIIDEVLAVGDVGFRIKSYNAINHLSKNSAVVFVSHSMPQVARIADRITLMSKGKSIYHGQNVTEGIEKYFEFFKFQDQIVFGDGVQLSEFSLLNSTKAEYDMLNYQDEVKFEINFVLKQNLSGIKIDLVFFDLDLKPIASCSSGRLRVSTSLNCVTLNIGRNNFAPGVYSINLNFLNVEMVNGREKIEILSKFENIKKFKSYGSGNINHVAFQLPGEWGVS